MGGGVDPGSNSSQLFHLGYIVILLSPALKIPGRCHDSAKTIYFHLISGSLFRNHPLTWH